MNKATAAIELMREARSERMSTAAARRVTRACKVLGMSTEEIRKTLSWLDYCDPTTGELYTVARKVKRVWP